MCILIDIAAPFIFSTNIRTAAEGARIGRSGEHYAEEVSYRHSRYVFDRVSRSGRGTYYDQDGRDARERNYQSTPPPSSPDEEHFHAG